jgi:hypothetical protein
MKPPSTMTTRHHQPVSLQQAVEASTVLARRGELSRDSEARLQAIFPILPAVLQSAVKAGPVDGENWCLIVKNNSVAAKIRQLLPAISARLRQQGWNVKAIRIKVDA